MSTQAQFNKLLTDIEPSSTTAAAASSAQQALRKYLAGHKDFKAVHVDTFLAGSYARDTSIRPRIIKGVLSRPDVDIVVVTNHTFEDDPAEVIELLLSCLDGEYEVTNPDNDRSVGVATAAVKMDVVPVIKAAKGDPNSYYIADRRLGRWIPTNPPGHTEWATRVNKATGGRFKPLVKLFKWWRRENPTAEKGNRPKGFVIEKIVADAMSATEDNYPELFTRTMESIVSGFAIEHAVGLVPTIEDPSVPGNNICSRLTFQEFSAFYKKADAHAKLARKALSETDEDKALEMWRQIFGDRFPASGKRAHESLLSTATAAISLSCPDHPVTPQKPAGSA